MLRSLSLKWIITLLFTSLIGVVLVGLFAYRTTTAEFDRLRIEQAQSEFIAKAAYYYETERTWNGFAALLRVQRLPPNPPVPVAPPNLFALADASGIVVVEAGPYHTGIRLNQQQLERGVPVEVDGEQVGTALLGLPPPELDPREQRYLENTMWALLLGAVGATSVALLGGIFLSRHFLNPLTELTRAIAAIREGHLDQQVPVRTQDELGVLAQTFNQMSAELSRANQLRKQMTADIAHDLRTPLSVIIGYLEALCDGTLKPTPARFEAMRQEAAVLQRLIEDLRTLSLADAGELKLVYQQVTPRELLEQVKQSFEPLASEQGVTLRLDADVAQPSLKVDPERMIQVLENLVSNALRYTPAGGTVILEARQRGSKLELVVRDTGVGIPEEKLPNIFERFYRIEESRTQDGESGLGLAIAKSIVEAHHGTIKAESGLGKGTSFTITLQSEPMAASWE